MFLFSYIEPLAGWLICRQSRQGCGRVFDFSDWSSFLRQESCWSYCVLEKLYQSCVSSMLFPFYRWFVWSAVDRLSLWHSVLLSLLWILLICVLVLWCFLKICFGVVLISKYSLSVSDCRYLLVFVNGWWRCSWQFAVWQNDGVIWRSGSVSLSLSLCRWCDVGCCLLDCTLVRLGSVRSQ